MGFRFYRHFRIGPGLPVWSAAFFPGNRTLLTGGTDRIIRRWDIASGEPIGDAVAGNCAALAPIGAACALDALKLQHSIIDRCGED